jgi:biotin carboxyl carrier protein
MMARSPGTPGLTFQGQGTQRTAIGRSWTNDISFPVNAAADEAEPDSAVRLVLAGSSDALEHRGEQLHVCERVVISPCTGVFEPTPAAVAPGARIEVGTILGRVSRRDVPSLFAGRFMAMLALPGERVRTNQPVAWLRAD